MIILHKYINYNKMYVLVLQIIVKAYKYIYLPNSRIAIVKTNWWDLIPHTINIFVMSHTQVSKNWS